MVPATTSTINRRIAQAAREQRGLATSIQLRDCGLSAAAISRWLASSRLFRIHPGVYAVGHDALDYEATVQAALLALPGSAASGSCAARLHGFYERGAPAVEIVVPRKHRPLEGVASRFTRHLPDRDRFPWHGLTLTTPERSMAELSDDLTPHQLANAIHEARRRRLTTLGAIERIQREHRYRRGHPTLARALELHRSDSGGTFSGAEDRALALLLRANLPEPLVNVRMRLGRRQPRLDFRWPDRRLCLEIDGGEHRLPRRRALDAELDEALRAVRYDVVRVPSQFVETVVEQVMPWFC